MFKRLLLGMLKGLIIGGALGALLHFALGVTTVTGIGAYLLYAAVGAVAGVLSGKAPWKPGAWVEALLKGGFGLGLGAGLYALANWLFTSPVDIPQVGAGGLFASHPLLFAPALAAVYAGLVELDNTGEEEESAPTGVRVGKVSVDDIDVGEEEEAAQSKPASKGARRG